MKSERIRIWIGLLFAGLLTLLAFVSVGCAANTYTVCSSGCDYPKIQLAVNDASEGDIIIVRDGTYTENVVVNVANLTLRSENGSAFTTVLAALNTSDVFFVTANSVTIMGFTVRNATDSASGIRLNYVHHCTVSGNNASGNYRGIYLRSSSNNSINNNLAFNNSWDALLLFSSNYNMIFDNTFNLSHDGINIDSFSNYNFIRSNIVSGNHEGIVLGRSSKFNTIMDNEITNHSFGIYLWYSANNNNITANSICKNYRGIYPLASGLNNIYFNEFIDNTLDLFLAQSLPNIWNSTYKITYRYNGNIYTNYLGNYWSNYSGSDSENDGIIDDIYVIDFDDIDYYPLMETLENYLLLPSEPYTKTEVGVTSNISLGDPDDITAYLPPEYDGMDLSDAVVLTVNVTDNNNVTTDDAYTDITINVGEMDIETCKVFKSDLGFLPEVTDVTTRPTVKPTGVPAFSRDIANNTVTIRLYVGDPLLAVLPLAEAPIFDTKEGTYPSISGTFTGTITPSRNFTVSILYTYYCEGTGGHTKSIELYDGTTPIATGVWCGYASDWHNITFTEVTLLKDHEYGYVIETGSYPQIIHADSKDVTGGRITCTEFIDSNGKRHVGWIPAIRLS